jgi:hypothetical protein
VAGQVSGVASTVHRRRVDLFADTRPAARLSSGPALCCLHRLELHNTSSIGAELTKIRALQRYIERMGSVDGFMPHLVISPTFIGPFGPSPAASTSWEDHAETANRLVWVTAASTV